MRYIYKTDEHLPLCSLQAVWTTAAATSTAAPATNISAYAEAGVIPTSAFIQTLLSQTSLSVLCPNIPSDGSQPMAPVVFPGCPCNATVNAASFQCPGGYRCSPASYHGLDSEVVLQPALGTLKAVCVPCQIGQFCPLGTSLKVCSVVGRGEK